MKTRRGDVVLVLFPNSDLRTAKRRPALVLQRNNLGSGLEQTIVAMISSNLARRSHPSRIFVAGFQPAQCTVAGGEQFSTSALRSLRRPTGKFPFLLYFH
jgi:mRNA-degrading endonuclease toxin of MazEF toxin-antitoxin module